MFRIKLSVIALIIAGCAIFSGAESRADGPRSLFKGLFGSSNKGNAGLQKEYLLDETNGPWMVYVKCYDGATAQEDARALALELRQKHGLNAYVYHKPFDHTEGLEEDEKSKQLELQFRQTLAETGIEDMPLHMPRVTQKRTTFVNGSSSEEYAVMVGDFQSINDNDINKAFEKIKRLEPDCIYAQLKRDMDEANQTGSFDRTTSIELVRMNIREQNNNAVRPLAKAFKCTNPILPEEYFSNRVDEFVQKLNEDSRYSLLRCPGKYTLKVAEYRGFVIADPKGIAEAEKNENKLHEANKLAMAGDKAETVCAFLREKGYEAYTFHDRTKSIVTVGSFKSLGQTDGNGNVIEYNPEINDLYMRFVWNPKTDTQLYRTSPNELFEVGKTVLKIPLLPTPETMEVPKAFANYNRR